MMSKYVTPGLLGIMRHETGEFLLHTYTRRQRQAVLDTDGDVEEDDWAQPITKFGDPVSGLACFYEVQDRTVVTPSGNLVINVPVLLVLSTDPLIEGDIVSDVKTKDGIVLVVGPVVAENVNPAAPNEGGPLFNSAELRVVDAVPSSIPQ